MRKALITGITGQDGSYLAELLLSKGYEVHGLVRRASSFNTGRIDHVYEDSRDPGARLHLHHGDMTDGIRLLTLLGEVGPDEVYNLAGQSQVRESYDQPRLTADVAAMGALHLLEAVRHSRIPCRVYQAGSSDVFGLGRGPRDEDSPLAPRSPHAAAKAYAHWTARSYREGYGVHAVNGIAFNHESPRRGETFVTRKISRAVARIQAGRQDYLYLGDLTPVRDWGYAPEYVEGMWRALQEDEPDDYVFATGTGHSVQEFVAEAFEHVGLDWERHVRTDERYLRPTEVDELLGDPARAAARLGWKASTTMGEIARAMVDADVAAEHEERHGTEGPPLVTWPAST